MHEPVSPDDDPAVARSNMVIALVLWAVSFALFAGTVAVALIYLALD